LGNRAKFGYLTLAYLLSGRLGSASETDVLALGRNIFDVDDLTKKVRTLLVLYLRPKYFGC
jgi:hypothetical protein